MVFLSGCTATKDKILSVKASSSCAPYRRQLHLEQPNIAQLVTGYVRGLIAHWWTAWSVVIKVTTRHMFKIQYWNVFLNSHVMSCHDCHAMEDSFCFICIFAHMKDCGVWVLVATCGSNARWPECLLELELWCMCITVLSFEGNMHIIWMVVIIKGCHVLFLQMHVEQVTFTRSEWLFNEGLWTVY